MQKCQKSVLTIAIEQSSFPPALPSNQIQKSFVHLITGSTRSPSQLNKYLKSHLNRSLHSDSDPYTQSLTTVPSHPIIDSLSAFNNVYGNLSLLIPLATSSKSSSSQRKPSKPRREVKEKEVKKTVKIEIKDWKESRDGKRRRDNLSITRGLVQYRLRDRDHSPRKGLGIISLIAASKEEKKNKRFNRKYSNEGGNRRQSLWFHPYVQNSQNENKTSVGKIKSDANKNIYDHFIDQENSLFVTKIDRSNQDLQTHFKNLCGELKESDIRLYRLTKRTLRSFLTEKFSARIADKFTAPLDMIIPFDYNEFCYTFNKLSCENKQSQNDRNFQDHIETDWISEKDLVEFNISKESQNKVKNQFYNKLLKIWTKEHEEEEKEIEEEIIAKNPYVEIKRGHTKNQINANNNENQQKEAIHLNVSKYLEKLCDSGLPKMISYTEFIKINFTNGFPEPIPEIMKTIWLHKFK